ncbi:MAG: TonB-dependent receptor, partial [Phycisphaerales bacterium]|nr:TonB-dependent receptor [Phycisphaerales bacterium]
NALLFGRGGTGGILNRVTKKGVIGEAFLGYKAGVDTFGEFGFELDGNYAVSDNAAIRINAMYENLNNHRDFYDGDRFGINPTAHIEFSSSTTLDISYEYVNHDRFIDRGIPTGVDGRPVEAFQDIVFGDEELNFHELEAHLFRAALQHEFTDYLKANVGVFYGDYDKLYSNFYASSYNQAATPTIVGIDGYIDATDRQNLIVSGNLVGEFETGSIDHTLIFGGEYINTSSDQNRFNAFWSDSADDVEFFTVMRPLNFRNGVGVAANGNPTTNDFTADLNDDTRVTINVFSAYIQDQIEVTDWLQLVGGVRFDSFDIEVNDIVAADTESRTDEEFSPRGGVIIKPVENLSIYASYSKSFLPRSGEQFSSVVNLDPDVFENKELGVKWDFTPNLSLTAAYFQNEQTRAARDNITGETFEVRGLEVEGFELQLQGQLTDQLFISAGYSYLEGETASGVDPRELPEHMASFWGTYQVTDRFGLGLGVIYQDESLITDGSTATLPSYTRLDAAAYYDVTDDIRVQVNVENLTDKLYFPNSHSTHQVTVGAPINARFAIVGRI